MSSLDQLIAIGRTAEIYLWKDTKVLKLFFPTIPSAWIDQEFETSRYIQTMPLPVPKVYEKVTVKDREGIVYEKIEGPSLLTDIATKPWTVVQAARLLAKLHVQVHQIPAPPHLEPQREWAGGGIQQSTKLAAPLREAVLQLLKTLPRGNQLCHGDFHPGNIILTKQAPMIIDWMTASKGTAAGDLARTSILLEVATSPKGTPMRRRLEWLRHLFHSSYVRTYLHLNPVEKQLFFAWRTIMAASFMHVCLPEEEPNLLKVIAQGLDSRKGG